MEHLHKGRTILLVEDERIVALAQQRSVEQRGYRVVCASSGEQAVAIACGEGAPDLILMDIDLGDGMDGTEAAVAILARREVPIVFLTGHSEQQTVDKVKGITRYGYVLKSSGEFVLRESIATAFELFDAHRRLSESRERSRQELDMQSRALEKALNGVVFTDLEGTIEYSNPAVRSIWGFDDAEEVLGRRVSELVVDPEAMRAFFRRAVGDGKAREEFAARRADGSTFPAEIYVSVVPGSEGMPERAIGSIVDISQRQRADDELTASAERYRHLAENVDDVIYRYEILPRKRAVYVNEASARVSGYTPQEYYDDPELVYRVIHPDDRYLMDLAAADSTVPERRLRIRWIHKDGEIRLTEQSYVPIVDETGTVTAIEAIARDVTEQETTRLALAAKTEELERFVNLVPEIVGTMRPDMTIVTVNEEVHRVLGFLPSEVVGRRITDFVHPNNVEATARELARLARGEEVESAVNRYRTDDGRYRWLEWRAQTGPDGLIYGGARDITARREAELELAAKEEKLRNVIESANVGTWQWDIETGDVEVNEILAAMLGYTIAELAPVSIRTWEALVHPEDRVRAKTALVRHLTRRTPDYDAEIRMRHAEGRWIWLHHRGRIMTRDEDVRAALMFGTYTDVTIQKEADATVRSLLQEKETMLKEVHHRIRNNMNTLGALLSLQSAKTRNAEVAGALDEARMRLQSMTVLYDRLYQTGRISAMSLRDYLDPLVDQIVSLFPHGPSIRVTKKLDDRILDTKTLATIGTAVNELLTNAMKHAFPPGRSGTISVSVTGTEDGLRLEVADDGVGMDTTSPRSPGTGYGLELIHTLAEQLNGTFRIERDGGTRFVLTARP